MAELDMKALQKKVSAGASYRKLVAAAEAGAPVCVASAGIPNEVMHAMGVAPIYPESLAAISAGIGKAGEFFEESRAHALSNIICSYTRCGLGICWSSKTAFGAIPRPNIAITDVNVCGLHLTWWAYLEDHFTLPTPARPTISTTTRARSGTWWRSSSAPPPGASTWTGSTSP